MRLDTLQHAWRAAIKDRIACADVRSLSVRVELLIQTESSRTIGVKDCQFLVSCFRFQPTTRKSSTLLLNKGILRISLNTRSRRLPVCLAILPLENRPSSALYDRRSASDRYGGWVVEDVLRRLAAVHGAVHSDLKWSPTCDARCHTPGPVPR